MNANFEYLCYGLMAAWLIVALYVLLLGLRESKLGKELDRVRHMVEPRGK
ncbi:MAG TPA: CcmD family protein [Bryobacteraceae bacterium]|jgi:CcmD family protein|nr:CcmD family protein [Bryobacteraceae bacterium]